MHVLHEKQVILERRQHLYAGRITCCPLVNHVEYAPYGQLRLENMTGETVETNKRTDGLMLVSYT